MNPLEEALPRYLAAESHAGQRKAAPATGKAPGRPILVGVDGSDSARNAVAWAAAEAVRRGLPLRLLHVWVTTKNEATRAVLHAATAVATSVAPGVEVHHEARRGSVLKILADSSAAADLLVLGAHGAGGARRHLVGPVAAALTVQGRSPVAVVHEAPAHGEGEPRPVVVGADDSVAGEAALDYAFQLASSSGAPLVVVRAWWEPATEAEEGRKFAVALESRRARHPEVAVTPMLTRAHRPVDALLDAVTDAGALVVGTLGYGAVTGVLLGSTSRAVLLRATCPVVVVRPQTVSRVP